MEFRILGPLEVVREGSVLPTPPNKPRALLALLLLRRGEAVGVEQLADELWGEHPPATATKSIQVYVSQLRKSLGEGVLETRGRGYALIAGDDALDAARFERLLRRGTELRAAGDRKAAAAVLTEALALWRGAALADFTYEPWAQAEIARLEDLRVAALEERIDADLELGRHATLIGELQGLLERHPGRERPIGQLMLALYRSGRQTEALDVYREQHRRLDEELGLEPSRALRELEAAILRQDPELGTPSSPSAAPGRRRPRRRRALLAAVGAAILLAGLGAASALTGDEERPARAAIRPLPSSSCSSMDYRPGTRPRHLIVIDQSSELAVISTQVSAAVEFVLRENGLAAGDTPIAFQACDSDSAGCLESAQMYADNPDVIGIIGPIKSVCAVEQIPVANEARPGPLAVISATNTSVGLTRLSYDAPQGPEPLYPTGIRNYVRVLAADDFQLAALAMYAQRAGARTVAVVADGRECENEGGSFGIAARRLDMELARCEFYSDELETKAGELARRVISSGADAVLIPPAAAGDSGMLIRELRDLGGRGVLILGADGFSQPHTPRELGPASERMRVTVPGVDPKALTGKARALIERLRETVGEPHPYTVAAVQATQLLLDAIARSDGTRRSVVSELFDSEIRGGVLGDFSVTLTGDTTANRVSIYRVENTELVLDRVLTPPLGLVVSPLAAPAPVQHGLAPEGRERFVVPVDEEDEVVRICEAAREGWPPAYAGHDSVLFRQADGLDLTCRRPSGTPESRRDVEVPPGAVRYVVPVTDSEHAARVCDAAREQWPDAYTEHTEVLLNQRNVGPDLICVRP